MKDTYHILFLIILIITKIQACNNSEDIYETEIIKNKILYENKKGSGAYYIAYSPFRDDYNRVTSHVRLPTKIETNNGTRTGFISFGIQGQYGYIDMGIMNSGNGWKTYYNDNGEIKSYDDRTANEDVKIITLDICEIKKKKIVFAVSFRDSGENPIDNIIYWHHIYSSHIFEGNEEDRPNLRLYRFVSLVNNKDKGYPDDQEDGTAMIGGAFTKLVLIVNNQGKKWGINGDYVEASWKVSPKKIEFKHGVDDFTDSVYDNFSIKYY